MTQQELIELPQAHSIDVPFTEFQATYARLKAEGWRVAAMSTIQGGWKLTLLPPLRSVMGQSTGSDHMPQMLPPPEGS